MAEARRTVLWVTGASSGIGAAFVDAAADRAKRIVGISRRRHPRAEHLAVDLGDPVSWPMVDRHVAEALAAIDVDAAVFCHCAGSVEAVGPLAGTDADAYAHAVLVNAAAGQVLGRAFLAAAERAGVHATLVMCSSPAATNPRAGLSHYSAGKAALEVWTRAVGAELGDRTDARVLCVVPHATDTAMVRTLIDTPPQDVPLSTLFRTAAADRTLASPEQVAREIWAAIDEPGPQGAVVHVGATGVAAAGDRRERLDTSGTASPAVARELSELLARYAAGVDLGEALADAHAEGDAVALTFEGAHGTTRLTYRELAEASARLAGALAEAGVGIGDRVAVLLPKSPELLVTLVAIWRRGAVHVPLFTAFGPDAVDYRLGHSEACLVVTDAANRPKIRSAIPVLCVESAGGDLDFAAAVAGGPALAGIRREPDDLFVLLYTSGTTGQPKGVEVPVRALGAIESYLRHGLDVRHDDVYWNLADPGWAYGLYCGVIGPLLLGQSILWRGVPFAAQDVYTAILRHSVTNLAGAPTVYRNLRSAGVPAGFRDAHCLRAISSAGEPLDAELLEWSERDLGVAIRDHYGQSELGMVAFFAQHPELRRKPVPGSMGTAAPGIRAVVVNEQGDEADHGELAIDTSASPAFWFRGYFRDAERTAERFRHGPRYYLTADDARLDESGLLFFDSRADDVITSSGYRIGPFEVEGALLAHPSVAEVAVIGTPDPLRVEAVTAYVVLTASATASDALVDELQAFVKARLAKHLFPRRVVFVDALPRTPSGKVMRTELRKDWSARAAGTVT